MELEVGRAVAAVGAGEEECLADGRRERAAPPREEVEQRGGLLGVGERTADRRVPDPDLERMVLEVRADRRARRPRRRCRSPELLGVADPRQHEQLRGADRAGREDHLPPRPGDRHRRLAAELDAADAPVGDLEPERGRRGQDRQVRAAGGRAQEGVGGAPPPAVLLRRLDEAVPFGLAVVVVGVDREAALPAGLDHQVGEAARAAQGRDVEQSADAVGRGGAGLVVLGADEVGEDVVPAPAGAAGVVAPAVVVGAVAAHVEHRVHRARAAEALAARHVEGAAVAAGLGAAAVVPVELRPELLGEGGRNLDVRRAVAAPGLDQQNLGA